MNFTNLILIFSVIVYVIVFTLAVNHNRKHKKIINRIQNKDSFYFFGFEKDLIEISGMTNEKAKKYIILLRILLLSLIVLVITKFGFIALFLFLAAATLVYSNNQNKKLIDDAGIRYIIIVNEFLDSYIPAISTGVSNDQAMLRFVRSQNDEELFNWWVNKSKPEFRLGIENKWRRIIEVYEMVRFNEERGISDSLPIIEEMQDDLNAKQKHYDDYQARIGEIKPIMFSYYIGIPIILFISWNQTQNFWSTIWGLVCAFVLAVLFFAFEMLIYKLKKSTIERIF